MKKGIILSIAVVVVTMAALSEGCACHREKTKKEVTGAESTLNRQADSVAVFPNITDGRGACAIYKSKGQTIYVFFNSDGYTGVSATLASSDPAANVRFSQIIMPDGEADGPFGPEMDYELKQQGCYTLVVNENMMAGDPWEGEFSVKVELNDKIQ